jgi:L-lactate dehydrogenase (cytochrome)
MKPGNYVSVMEGNDAVTLADFVSKSMNRAADWSDFAWLRDIWKGPLVIKGVMSVKDAILAVDHGADGILVSNHGGRQLDGSPSTISVLPKIVDAVGDRAEVFVDGGIRRGADVVKAIAIGARACFVGRPYMWGLAIGGEAGVVRVLEILREEIDRTLALIGRPNLREVNRSAIDIK